MQRFFRLLRHRELLIAGLPTAMEDEARQGNGNQTTRTRTPAREKPDSALTSFFGELTCH